MKLHIDDDGKVVLDGMGAIVFYNEDLLTPISVSGNGNLKVINFIFARKGEDVEKLLEARNMPGSKFFQESLKAYAKIRDENQGIQWSISDSLNQTENEAN